MKTKISNKKNIMKFAGAWKDMSEEEAEEIKANIRKIRKNSINELISKIKK